MCNCRDAAKEKVMPKRRNWLMIAFWAIVLAVLVASVVKNHVDVYDYIYYSSADYVDEYELQNPLK